MKCIIIEDEIPAQRVLQNYISKFDELELLGNFQSALTADTFLKANAIDLIFMDINLPDISGMQYVKTLQNPPAIIMTTAYPEYAAESFEVGTIQDYLVKPFSFARFFKAISKMKNENLTTGNSNNDSNTNANSTFLNIDKTLHKINFDDILYIESDRNYITITTKSTKLTYIDSLRNWGDKLPEEHFIQVHKSYIINLNVVEKVMGNMLYIEGSKIPIGRSYKSHFLKKIIP